MATSPHSNRRWRVRVLLVPNAPTVANLPPDSGLLGGGLRGGTTSAVGRTGEPPPPPPQSTLRPGRVFSTSQLTD
ncbi:hypothetical protein Hanom_Chr09g00846501 [Helianthus anomalus]